MGIIENEAGNHLRYRIGIDVGSHSTGYAAVEVDDSGMPVSILNSVVFMHDSGIDPDGAKFAQTRKARSGFARRARRLVRARKKRLKNLDETLMQLGYPLVDLETLTDPHAPWHIRAALTDHFIEDPEERLKSISIAIRHIARHRGWRSPYAKIETLFVTAEPSEFLVALNSRVGAALGQTLPPDLTPGEVISQYLTDFPEGRIRGAEGILSGKLHQTDNAQEIRLIAQTQKLSDDDLNILLRKVFYAKSPRGSASALRGKDALPGQGALPRAEKAHPVFQLFRIAGVLTNLRIVQGGVSRQLDPDELSLLVDLLTDSNRSDDLSWADVAETLGVSRRELRGTAKEGVDGAPSLSRPPIDVTDRAIRESKIPWLVEWWDSADLVRRGLMIDALSNSGGSQIDTEIDDEIAEVLEQATETDQEKFEKINLPSGRAAYSLDSMSRLTDAMLEMGIDLHEARKYVFRVDDTWTPPADPIGLPVGNPAVDRVTKQINRWLMGIESRFGTPESIYIEHVRNALGSEKVRREYERDIERRRKANMATYESMREQLNISGRTRRSELIRYQAIQRQGGNCAYCGCAIDFRTAEMDHIVPRAGAGSTNTRSNLLAVCRRCNHSKGKMPFAVWAATTSNDKVSLENVIQAIRVWERDSGMTAQAFNRFKREVIERLTLTTPDDEIDGRSLESVAWMASELRHRIDAHFNRQERIVDVAVFRGSLTASARKASGFENRVNLIGGHGKTRFDRRHHAMDAVVIALMDRSVAKTLAERDSIRDAQRISGEAETWKSYTGATVATQQRWNRWKDSMLRAVELFNLALTDDAIPILENMRLRQGSGAIHEATISELSKVALGAELSSELIDRAATPALWTALTRHPDYNPSTGLPADSNRHIRVNGTHFRADDKLPFFKSSSASVMVRGGSAQLGNAIHHARIYRIEGKKKPIYAMLRVYQIDLAKVQDRDLFTAPLAPSTISVRTAEPKLRTALASGTASYIGWLVEGDELRLDPSSFNTHAIGTFFSEYPRCQSWRIAGFPSPSRFRLRPMVLSGEGLPEGAGEAIQTITFDRGWLSTVNTLLSTTELQVVRRNALGERRITQKTSLPSSYVLR
ncbi:HNH endonuclease [Schaalia sp. ZJ405]|uniref:type II CRISPR RNA-guided endonuclease Cas9 n=1 Tax=Schaalia sp. ZJ405 TaxID=2709403 RepID=UPI0013EA0D98|nr:type II CRISPR RNA-guided endonuclease Cas9 [Schaalia sp. ZJ405]QPK81357.1 HNH endonuclease [Schaalia sp. ZJ405]